MKKSLSHECPCFLGCGIKRVTEISEMLKVNRTLTEMDIGGLQENTNQLWSARGSCTDW